MNWYVNMQIMKIVNKRTNEFMNKYLDSFYVKNIEQSPQT